MGQVSEILKQDADAMYRVTEALFGFVDDLDWKPATGANWMTTGQLLRHCSEACGKSLRGFITGDWGMPEGQSTDDIPEEDMLPSADRLPTVDGRRTRSPAFRVLGGPFFEGSPQQSLAQPREVAPQGVGLSFGP